MTYTENYRLKKLDGEDFIDVEDLNQNMEKIDTQLKAQAQKAEGDGTKVQEVQAALEQKADLKNGKVPAEQLPEMDYIASADRGAPGGVATLGSDGKVPEGQLPAMNYDPKGTAEAAVVAHNSSAGAHADIRQAVANTKAAAQQAASALQSGLDTHTGNKNNPHNVTRDQIGAAAAEHTHSADDINSGILPVARGGTGAATASSVRKNLGVLSPVIAVTAPTGSTVTAKSGNSTVTGTESSGTWALEIPHYGTWTITATLGADSASTTVVVDAVKQYAVKLVYAKVYGAEWAGGSSTAWTRTDAAANFSDPVPYVSGASSYSSPFDNCMPWSGMVKETHSDAGVVVKIPKFWFKWTKSGSKLKLQIADGPVDGFSVSPAHMDRGDGKGERDAVYVGRYHSVSTYESLSSGFTTKVSITRSSARESISNLGSTIWQWDLAMLQTIQMLYLVEFADWNSQTKIGYGCGNSSSAQHTGTSDTMPYHTGTMQSSRTTYGAGVQYRYIEDLWGNVYDWLDGCYYNSSGLNVILNPANFSDSTGGTAVGTPSSGHPSAMSVSGVSGFEWCMYPTAANGSQTTFVPDYWDFSASYPCLFVGGYYGQYLSHGLFYVNFNSASNSNVEVGCRLQKLP
ncbi:MAG: hypothetical protein KH138_05715 [Firmicutes bacterium]|nr:hypothetical protein [Bacillota bacterium]